MGGWGTGQAFLLLVAILVGATVELVPGVSGAQHAHSATSRKSPRPEAPSLEDLDADLMPALGMDDPLDDSETVRVPFAVLKKRPLEYLGARVCFRGAILTIREEFDVTYMQVVVRTGGRLDITHQVMIEHLARTHFLPGDEVRFCGAVMGPVEIPTQANWRLDAIEILADQLSKVRSLGVRSRPAKPVVSPPNDSPECKSPDKPKPTEKSPVR